MQPFDVVKVWYQNDWGLYGRRDERLCRALAADPRVHQVVHLEPPLSRNTLAQPDFEAKDPLGWSRRSTQGVQDGGVSLFTPTFDEGSERVWPEVLQQVKRRFQELGLFRRPALLWVSAPGPLGEMILRHFGESFQIRVTELEDDHRQYFEHDPDRRSSVEKCMERMVRSADLLLSNNRSFLEEFARLDTPSLHLPNAVDTKSFGSPSAPPDWFSSLPGPRLVYVGALNVRWRADLVEAVAAARPDCSVVLCGGGSQALPPSLTSRANVHCPGRVAPEQVPSILCGADVLLLPHSVAAMTEAMDPQKLPEYLASGRPIVATSVAGVREHADLIDLADDVKDFVEGVERVLRGEEPARSAQRRERVAERTWERAADTFLQRVSTIPDAGCRWRREQRLQYFEHDRPELRALVAQDARDVLDIGCGAGAVGEALARGCDSRRVTGIELDAEAAERAATRLHRVHRGRLEEVLPTLEERSFDCVLLADVLEHVVDSETVLAQVSRVLRPGGQLLLGLPNVRHWSVLRQLLEGEFRYENAGILDATHLRFFTRRSAARLLERCGFQVQSIRGSTWQHESVPPEVVEALRASGLSVGDLEAESSQHQWLFHATVAVETPAVPATPRSPPSIGVVIPVCNAAEYTEQCLREIETWAGDRVDEIVVVDNGSTDATAQVLTRSRAQVIRNDRNMGYAAAVNQGLRALCSERALVLNNDVLLMDGFLERLESALDAPNVAMVGPTTNYANGRQQIDCGAVESAQELREFAARWAVQNERQLEDVSFLSGFCLLARRLDLLEVEGFAEAYGPGTYEDNELSRRLRRAGRRLVVARDSFVFHFGNRTFRTLGIDLGEQQKVNQKLFLERHGSDRVLEAQRAVQDGDLRGAFKLTTQQLLEQPRDLDALRWAAEILVRLNRREQGTALITRYLGRCPDDRSMRALYTAWTQRSESPSDPASRHCENTASKAQAPVTKDAVNIFTTAT